MTPSEQKVPNSPRRYKRLAMLVALVCVALQVGRRVELAALALVLWLVTVALEDRKALDRLKMPKFWAILILVALGSGLFLGPRDLDVGGLRLSARGLEAGALMLLRGAFIFALASWVTRAIDKTKARSLASRVGMGNLALAVATAFGVLPALRDQLGWRKTDPSKVWKQRLASGGELMVQAVAATARLADRLSEELMSSGRAHLIVVVGPKGVGKTTALERLAAALVEQDLAVGGVIQPAIEKDTRRIGYDLLDLSSGERRSLARRRPEGKGFDFEEDAWPWTAERVARAQADDDVVVIDELGLLEAEGKGHLPALLELTSRPGRAVVLLAAVREGCLEPIEELLGTTTLNLEAPLDSSAIERSSKSIARLVKEAREGALEERVDS